MIKSKFMQAVLPIGAMLIVYLMYFAPVLGGKSITQDDIMMGKAKQHQIKEYREKNNEEPLWTNSMFSGMPTFQLSTSYPNNIFSLAQKSVSTLLGSSSSIYIIAALMLSFFFLLKAHYVNPWLSAIGAFAFAFSAFFIISFAAGHLAKVRSVAYSVPMLLGILLAFQGKRWIGAALTAFFTGFSVYSNHFQITFYIIILVVIITVTYAVEAYRTRKMSPFFKTCLLLLIAAIIGAGPNFSNVWSTQVYSKESMRGGGSELSTKENKNGLDFEYAMSWSYGPLETMNLFIPNIMGGGSKQTYAETETFDFINKYYRQQGVGRLKAEEMSNQFAGSVLYWGKQSLVNGGYYVGAICLFLFVLGIFLVPGVTRQWIITAIVVFTLMAWGKNVEWFNRFLFDYIPLVNKFRVPSMSLAINFILIPFFAFIGLQKFYESDKSSLDSLKRTYFITAGIVAFFALLGPIFFDFEGIRDPELIKQGLNIEMLQRDRAHLLRTSAFRSFILISMCFFLLWFSKTKKIKSSIAIAGLAALFLFDLVSFDRDQLGDPEFLSPKEYNQPFQASAADMSILNNEKDLFYRVYNAANGLTSDSYTSYFHHSIGGYHGAKLQRYQDLIDYHLSKGNMAVFNMLNTKWIIQKNQQGKLEAYKNANACGNAWFIDNVQWVSDANEEIAALNDFDPSKTVVIDVNEKPNIGSWQKGSESSIQLKEYDEKHMTYTADVKNDNAIAVFSEVFYKPKYQAWESYVDGQLVDHFRVNYALRGMKLGKGQHVIEFKFEPQTYLMGAKVNLIFSVLLVLFVLFSLWKSKQIEQIAS